MDQINVPVQQYNGSNKKKKQEYLDKLYLAKKIEDYLNDRYMNLNKGSLTIMFNEVASEINEPLENIRKLCTAIQGSSNGVTFHKWKYNKQFNKDKKQLAFAPSSLF